MSTKRYYAQMPAALKVRALIDASKWLQGVIKAMLNSGPVLWVFSLALFSFILFGFVSSWLG